MLRPGALRLASRHPIDCFKLKHIDAYYEILCSKSKGVQSFRESGVLSWKAGIVFKQGKNAVSIEHCILAGMFLSGELFRQNDGAGTLRCNGAYGIRTHGLNNANVARSQLR